MRGLTVHQPHANAILYYGKDIENRSRCMNIRGTIALHAGLQFDDGVYFPENFKAQIVRGAIIGVVDILNCVDEYESKWFFGPFGYLLDNPRPLQKPIPCKGMLGFWSVPAKIEKEILRQLKGSLRKFQ